MIKSRKIVYIIGFCEREVIACGQKGRCLKVKKNIKWYLFLMPFYIFFIWFWAIPSVNNLVYSFFKIDNLNFEFSYVGLDNYKKMFSDHRFIRSLTNTVFLVIGLTILIVLVSLFIANAVHRSRGPVKTFVRAAIYIPAITAEVILIMTWKFIFNPSQGILNYITGLFGIQPQDWLGNPSIAPFAVLFVVLTFTLGTPLIIFMAALGGIPDNYYEAATIDGANGIQRFFKITLPLLRPTMAFVIITSTIAAFQVFSVIYLMTGGGPAGATSTLVFQLYNTAFKYWDLGGASVISVVLFVICTIIAIIQYRFLLKRYSILRWDYEKTI